MTTSHRERILMTADTVGGVWTYAIELARAFESHGIDVLLASMGRPLSLEQRDAVDSLQNVTVAESNFRLEWMDEPWADVRAAGDWLLALEREFEPDLVHLNGYAHGALPWRAPKIVVGHSCVLSWWQGVKQQRAPESWRIYRDAVTAGLQAADLVIAPTRAMLDCLLENYGDLAATQVIPNGRRLDLFGPKRKENFILSAGRLWDEAKNVRAVCACSLDLPWPVCVAGDTELAGASAVTERGTAPHNVKSLGRLNEAAMVDQFARAAIFAHPAKYEPFGLAVLEAALSGCALVLGDVPALRENWSGAALFVDPDDASQLRKTLLDLIDKPILREELGCVARSRGLGFDIQLTAERYIEAYSKLISQSGRRHGKEECIPA